MFNRFKAPACKTLWGMKGSLIFLLQTCTNLACWRGSVEFFFFFLTGVVSLRAGMYDMALQAKSSKIAVSVIGRLTRPEKFENLLS